MLIVQNKPGSSNHSTNKGAITIDTAKLYPIESPTIAIARERASCSTRGAKPATSTTLSPSCKGSRLREEVRYVRVGEVIEGKADSTETVQLPGYTIGEISHLSLRRLKLGLKN
ncbi:hypothetical protein OURE66S_04269 [Oligella ureolytica]